MKSLLASCVSVFLFLMVTVGCADKAAPEVQTEVSATAPGFEYDNLGYRVYAAALQKQTGKSWPAKAIHALGL